MGLYRSLGGSIRVELTGADIDASLSQINSLGIPLHQIARGNELTVCFTVHSGHYQRILTQARRRGDRLKILNRLGIFWWLKGLTARPIILFGMALVLFLAMWLPGRILFVSVEGNQQIPEFQILEAAEGCGIGFGASRREVRSEQVKNRLLYQLPDLQWAGVNTYGCRAVITVRERTVESESEKMPGVSNMVAIRDGVVRSVTVTRGTALCVPGQAVERGQVLISGYMDHGLVICATGAEGEVFAETSRELQVRMPRICLRRAANGAERTKYSLLVGKKRINFYKGSGISGGSCVKMYWKYVLTLPGGFELPVALIRETVMDCVTEPMRTDESSARDQLARFAERYLLRHMIAGRVTGAEEMLGQYDGFFQLTGNYACEEMIGRCQEEMIGEYHGKNNGTNRERGSGG